MATSSPVTFSIVIATSGRSTITTTLAALTPQLQSGDEILIERLDCDWGHEARNLAMPRCAGTHLMFIDDDDRHVDGALNQVRAALDLEPDRVHLFAMRYHDDGRVLHPLWPLRIGSVSTAMLVVPNVPDLLGQWGDRYEGDFDFIASTMLRRGDEPVLHPDVIAEIGTPSHARALRAVQA